MDVAQVLLTGLDRFGGVLARLTPESGATASPCTNWNARALTGHVLTVLESASSTLRGENFDWSAAGDPATVGGADPQAAFAALADHAREALAAADLDQVVTTPMGQMPIRQRLAFPAMDLHLHAWDLGQALGVPVELEPAIADFVHAALDPIPEEIKRSDGVFGPEVEPPVEATGTERLMAWSGRQIRR